MAAPRACRRCRYDFTPRRLRPFARECEPCRTHFMAPHPKGREPVTRDGHVRTYHLGLLGDPTAVAMQASIAGGVRRDPSKLPPGELDAIRRKHLPTPDEHTEDVLAANRQFVLGWLATPQQAVLAAALDPDGTTKTEGDAP